MIQRAANLRDPAFVGALVRRRARVSFVSAGVALADIGGVTKDVPFADGAVGDLLIIAITVRGAVSIATPAGWALVTSYTISFLTTHVFSRVRQSGDSGVVTVTVNATSAQTTVGQMFAFRGASTINVGAVFLTTASASTIGPIPGITIQARAAVLVLGSRANDWPNVDSLSGDGLTWIQAGVAKTSAGGDAGQVVDVAIAGSASVVISPKTWTTDEVGAARGGVMLEVAP